jgi:tRNA(fMet)-specific endonuclease VapC
MNGEFLLDTNIIIALFSNENKVLQNLTTFPTIYLSSIVLGELYFGARKSQRVNQNMAKIDELIKEVKILVPDMVTAQHYGIIKSKLSMKGKPLPENDIWIAAIAKHYDLTLVSRDQHFEHIEDLRLEKWL